MVSEQRMREEEERCEEEQVRGEPVEEQVAIEVGMIEHAEELQEECDRDGGERGVKQEACMALTPGRVQGVLLFLSA